MRIFLPVVLAGLLAGAVILYFYQDHLREKKLHLRVQKLYASQLYEDMIPMLSAARHHAVEQMIVDKTGVSVKYLQEGGPETAFLLRPNGYRYFTPEQQEAMRTVLEECIPKLAETEKYHVVRKRITLLNGDTEYAYQYLITNSYKARLNRAAYYDGTLQPHSW